MPEYVLNRNYALRTLAGRIINFEKGQPAWVPPECEKEALLIGAEPVNGPKDILDPEPAVKPEISGQERTDLIVAAFKTLQARDGRGDFSANGYPSVKAIEKIVGFDITTKERDDLWVEFRAGDE